MADYEIIIDCGGDPNWKPPKGAKQIGPRQWQREWGPPDYADRHCRRADNAVAEDDAKKALEECGKALAQVPDFPPAFLARGVARHMLGDEKGAEADWAKAMQLDGSLERVIQIRRDWLANKKEQLTTRLLDLSAKLREAEALEAEGIPARADELRVEVNALKGRLRPAAKGRGAGAK